jgi:hypothetical protein
MFSPTLDDEKNDRFFYPSIEQQVAQERYDDAQISRHLREQARPQGDAPMANDPRHDAEEGTKMPVLQPTIGNSPPHRAGGPRPTFVLDAE